MCSGVRLIAMRMLFAQGIGPAWHKEHVTQLVCPTCAACAVAAGDEEAPAEPDAKQARTSGGDEVGLPDRVVLCWACRRAVAQLEGALA